MNRYQASGDGWVIAYGDGRAVMFKVEAGREVITHHPNIDFYDRHFDAIAMMQYREPNYRMPVITSTDDSQDSSDEPLP